MSTPIFSDDSTEQEYDGGSGDKSDSPVKGVIKWEETAGEYVFVWWQKPFRILFDNGGYAMSDELYESIPDHITTFWIVDEKRGLVSSVERAQYEDGMEIGPKSDRFHGWEPAPQTAIPVDAVKESYPLNEVESLH